MCSVRSVTKKQDGKASAKKPAKKEAKAGDPPARLSSREFSTARDMFRNGNFVAAASVLESIVRREPGNFEALIFLASCYSFQGRYDEAVRCHEAAVEADPSDAQRWHNLASDLLNLGDLERAEKAMKEAIKLDGKSGYSHYGLARIFARKGEHDEALSILKKAVELQPGLKENMSDQPDFAALAGDNRFKELLGLKKDDFDYPFFERGET
jgi:tetratricopeptide (TPR) repeat protein